MLPLQLRTRYIAGLVENIQEHFERETGTSYSRQAIETALTRWLESRFDRMLEELGEVITSPHLTESQEFRKMLDEEARADAAIPAVGSDTVAHPETATVFTGNRQFSPERLGAMIRYIVDSGYDIYKTNLNKLLFYSDLTNYYLRRQGISGATYVNLPFGPVPQNVNDVLEQLENSCTISRQPLAGNQNAMMIKPGERKPHEEVLSPEEKQTIDWVLNNYGSLSSTQISELSHKERAYANTRPNEPIAYEYAKFFRKLPQ
jgi:uncharacterized phage-associated protein